jgi:hypothetical protein
VCPLGIRCRKFSQSGNRTWARLYKCTGTNNPSKHNYISLDRGTIENLLSTSTQVLIITGADEDDNYHYVVSKRNETDPYSPLNNEIPYALRRLRNFQTIVPFNQVASLNWIKARWTAAASDANLLKKLRTSVAVSDSSVAADSFFTQVFHAVSNTDGLQLRAVSPLECGFTSAGYVDPISVWVDYDTTQLNCATQIRDCPDGSTVTQQPSLFCNYPECPGLVCQQSMYTCPNGDEVSYNPNNWCYANPCPEFGFCAGMITTCPNGIDVGQDPNDGCNFYPCPVF